VSPPAHVGLLDRGVVRWVTQRPKPYTNCMFAALCVPLSFMGYDLPADFVDQLREASGVPRDRPTSTADTRRALKKLIPDCPIDLGGLADDVILRRLADGEIVVRVELRVADLPVNSPTHKHFKPTYTGGHAVALAGAERLSGGGFNVVWLDPMGRPVNNYHGLTVPFSDIEPALRRTPSGKVKVAVGAKDAALEENADEVDRVPLTTIAGNPIDTPVAGQDPEADALVLTRGRPDEFVSVQGGTPFLHPITRAVVTKAVSTDEFRLAGRSIDGKFAGIWVNTRHIKKSRGPTLLIVDRKLIGVPFTKPG